MILTPKDAGQVPHANPPTRHHFVSQIEQRMNAVDRSLPKRQQRIHEFEIRDRDAPILSLKTRGGTRIRETLQLYRLYAFKGEKGAVRDMESLLGQFESQYRDAILHLEMNLSRSTTKIAFIAMYRILALKLLHLFRNPYGIKKAVSMLPEPERWLPNDRKWRSWHRSIQEETEHPLLEDLAGIGVSLDEFRKWRLGLLLLLMKSPVPLTDGYPFAGTLLGRLAHDLLLDDSRITWLVLDVVSENRPGRFLLSDRGYTARSEPRDSAKVVLQFNLSDRIACTFCSIDPGTVPHPNPPWINSTLLDAVHAELTAKPEIKLIFDDPTRLAEFNEGAIYYAHRHVYCSRAHVVGAVVE